jgi:hypothetical protein
MPVCGVASYKKEKGSTLALYAISDKKSNLYVTSLITCIYFGNPWYTMLLDSCHEIGMETLFPYGNLVNN